MATSSRRTREQMYPLIEAYLTSGLTREAFCAQHNLTIPTLSYWLAKYRRESSTESAFVELDAHSASPEQALMEVIYPSGVRLRLFTLVPPAYLEHAVSLRS